MNHCCPTSLLHAPDSFLSMHCLTCGFTEPACCRLLGPEPHPPVTAEASWAVPWVVLGASPGVSPRGECCGLGSICSTPGSWWRPVKKQSVDTLCPGLDVQHCSTTLGSTGDYAGNKAKQGLVPEPVLSLFLTRPPVFTLPS